MANPNGRDSRMKAEKELKVNNTVHARLFIAFIHYCDMIDVISRHHNSNNNNCKNFV